MATTAQQMIDRATREIGYTEDPAGSNRTKYGRFYGMDGNPWCAMFLWWVAAQAGDKKPLWLKTAYTPTFAQYFMDGDRWGAKPKPGAIVFFDFPDSLHRIQHVGIVEKEVPGGCVSIEGNTSSDAGGSQDNGGVVARRIRTSSIVGYGYPVYHSKPKDKGKPARTFLAQGDDGADVRTWQRDLNEAREVLKGNWSEVKIDGHFGSDTLKATRGLERLLDLRVNGKAEVGDILKLERKLRKAV